MFDRTIIHILYSIFKVLMMVLMQRDSPPYQAQAEAEKVEAAVNEYRAMTGDHFQ